MKSKRATVINPVSQDCPVDGCACHRIPDPHWCDRCGKPYHPSVCPDCMEYMTKESIARAHLPGEVTGEQKRDQVQAVAHAAYREALAADLTAWDGLDAAAFAVEAHVIERLASAPNIGGTEAHRALNYLWSGMQAAGIASGDLAGAYVTVREALNERQETPR